MEDFTPDIALIGRIEAVPTILDVICRTTGMGFAAVARVTEGRWVACSVLDKISFGLKPGEELKVETTICHEIRQHERPVVIDHVLEDEEYRDHHTPRQYGFQSYISMPIFLEGGKFFGTLCAIDPKPAKLQTPEVIGMFKLFAELIASHINTTEKLAQTESHLELARQASELREQFIGVLGHDLRTPLGAISMGAALLKQTALDEDQADTVEMMRRSVTRMGELIEHTMDFARGRLGGGLILEDVTEIALEPLLRQVAAETRLVWPERAIEAHFDLAEKVVGDPRRLAQLFTNLLSNAMTHGKGTAPVRVSAVSGGGRFELWVANEAEPIPASVMERLFEPFSRGGKGNYQAGLGLGLYIAAQITKSHKGQLTVSTTVEETRFTFVIER